MADQYAGEGAGRPVQTGSLIAGHQLEERIGAGGMAVVFRAHDRRLDRRVALKVAVEAGGLTALLTVTNSGRLQGVSLGDLP